MKEEDKIVKLLEEIKHRLNALLAINIAQLRKEKMTMREQIKLLNNLGLKYDEIAHIIRRSEGYVSSELAIMRKKRQRKGKRLEK